AAATFPNADGRRPVGLARWLARSAGATAALSALAFLVLWAADGFGTVRFGEVRRAVAFLPLPTRLGPVDVAGLPVPTSAASVLKQVEHQRVAHDAYLLGVRRLGSWR